MKREEFLRLCGGMFLAAGLPEQLMARMAEPVDGPQALKSIRRITIAVGATKPFKALHLSDTSRVSIAVTVSVNMRLQLRARGSFHGRSITSMPPFAMPASAT